MKTDRKWIVVRIDGKIASISTDYRLLASISASLANIPKDKDRRKKSGSGNGRLYESITATVVGTEEVWKLKQETSWDDLMLFGTEFQKKVWRKLWELTHPEQEASHEPGTASDKEGVRLICYSDFAELCQNRAGVRAVAHAIGLNPVSVVIPCHLVIPKESIDKIRDIHKKSRGHHLSR